MEFEEYLRSKKIDAQAFKASDLSRFAEWEQLFSALHADSFTAQKKFLVNAIRRRYRLPDESTN